jgi:hypothetical protein
MAVKAITPAYWKEWVVLAPGAAVARGPALNRVVRSCGKEKYEIE